jgi:hypothetical protein
LTGHTPYECSRRHPEHSREVAAWIRPWQRRWRRSIIFESLFKISTSGRDIVALNPEEKAKLAPFLECFGKTVATVSVTRKDGVLTLTFTDGTVIEATSDAKYEAWEVNARGVKIIAMPGGGEPALFT